MRLRGPPATQVIAAFACLVASIAFSACSSRLPTYRWTSKEHALRALQQRADAVKTVEATCSIALRDAQGESVALDGALAARHPGWLHLRAWKFNHAVFDLTSTPEGVWLMTEGEPPSSEGQGHMPRTVSAEQIARAWSIFTGGWLDEARVITGGPTEPRMIVTAPLGGDGSRLTCQVDLPTLTPRHFEVRSAAGRLTHSIELSRYRMIDDRAWPMVMALESDAGRIKIEMDDVELNSELAERAFVPPRRAVKQP